MKEEDIAANAAITVLLNEAIEEAIKTSEIQNSLRRVVGDSKDRYDAVDQSLRDGARTFLRTQLSMANGAEIAHYADVIGRAGEALEAYLNTFPTYRDIRSTEEELTNLYKTKIEQHDQLGTKILAVRSRESLERMERGPSADSPGTKRRLFSRQPFRKTESEQLDTERDNTFQEIFKLGRAIADVATNRKRFELTMQSKDPQFKERKKNVQMAERPLREAALEFCIPYLHTSIQEYAALKEEGDEQFSNESEVTEGREAVSMIRYDDNSEEEVGLIPSLETSPATSIGVVGPGDKRSVFLVHGRDERTAMEMRALLRALRLQVIEWENAVQATGHGSPYLGDVILAGMRLADAVVVLSSPDDLVRLRPDLLTTEDPGSEREIRGQARANVIYEAGFADAIDSSRTILVELGGVKTFSDMGGRNAVRFDGGARSRHKLVSRLRSAGLEPDITGGDWLDTGDFDARIEAARMALAAATQA